MSYISKKENKRKFSNHVAADLLTKEVFCPVNMLECFKFSKIKEVLRFC